MRYLCKTCGKYWNVSILQEIPKTGYECPKCAIKRKRRDVKSLKIPGKHKGQATVRNGNMAAFMYGGKKNASQRLQPKRRGKK